MSDDFGQHDGDGAWGRSPFARTPTEQPWLRRTDEPWKLWGNEQTITMLNVAGNASPVSPPTQLLRVSYKRPETWHWLFSATLLRGPQAIAGFGAALFVSYNLTVGIGRTAITIPGFELLGFQWAGPLLAPINTQIWSTQSRAPNRIFATPNPAVPVDSVVDQIVAQDIQMNVTVSAGGTGGLVGDYSVLVAAMMAPKSHVRPDWYIPDAPDGTPAAIESVFPGDEIGGR